MKESDSSDCQRLADDMQGIEHLTCWIALLLQIFSFRRPETRILPLDLAVNIIF